MGAYFLSINIEYYLWKIYFKKLYKRKHYKFDKSKMLDKERLNAFDYDKLH